MDFNVAYRAIAKERGYSIPAAAEAAGTKYGSLANVLKRNNPGVQVAAKYLKALGYEVVLAPVGAKLPSGCYVIEEGEE